MKTIQSCFLLALCLTISAAGSPKDKREVVLKETAADFEKAKIKAGVDRIGIGQGYEIVVADACDLVENTAAQEMQRFLAQAEWSFEIVPESKATGGKRIILGRESNLKVIRDLGDKGEVKLRDVSAEDDGFHLTKMGTDIVIAGANPRGVLYGVYALEDFIKDGAHGLLNIKKVPYFRKRSNATGSYFNRYWGEFTEADAEYLSRLGINQFTSCDGSGDMSHLHELVKSDILPFQNPPRSDYRRKVKAMAATCQKYGIDFYLMLWEPIVAQVGAEIGKYPPEALGTVKRPWGGGKDGTDRTLCVNSPIVQKHYRNMVKKFVREFSDVKGFFFYNLDGSTWLCTPDLCGRCASAVKDSPHDLYNPWETQARLVSLLADAAHNERPDFKFNFWGDVHFHGETAEKLLRGAHGYDALSTGWDGSDHDIMVPEVARPGAEFRMTQTAAKERGVPMYVYFAYNRLESVPQGFAFPFHVCASLKKFKDWGARNLIEVTGPTPAFNSINALTMREFQCDPDGDPAKFLWALSVKQFGVVAGRSMFKAWEEIKAAMDVWNGYAINPLSGSQPYLSIGTMMRGTPRAILPDLREAYNYEIEVRTIVEPWRAADYQRFKEKPFLKAMELMSRHLAQAAKFAKDAVDSADSQEFIGLCFYNGSAENIGRPTCKEYAELNYASIAIADALCRQQCNLLRAYHLLTEIESIRSAGNERSVRENEKLYHELVREDIGVQERFCELLMSFAEMRPCYTRTSLTDGEITDLLAITRAKIQKLKAFLAMNEAKVPEEEKANKNR